MKYKVTINVYYDNCAEFLFDTAETAMQFMQLAAEHLVQREAGKETELMLAVIADVEEGAEDE